MIPKIIHYCWFGGKDLPQSAKKYIESWEKFLPSYEIKRWDESNFDVNAIKYTREAYAAKKYAFVSDFARFWILFNYGGLYFDTDVEIIETLYDIIEQGSFMGVESRNDYSININPGLGFGSEAGNEFLGRMIEIYKTFHFLRMMELLILRTSCKSQLKSYCQMVCKIEKEYKNVVDLRFTRMITFVQ